MQNKRSGRMYPIRSGHLGGSEVGQRWGERRLHAYSGYTGSWKTNPLKKGEDTSLVALALVHTPRPYTPADSHALCEMAWSGLSHLIPTLGQVFQGTGAKTETRRNLPRATQLDLGGKFSPARLTNAVRGGAEHRAWHIGSRSQILVC